MRGLLLVLWVVGGLACAFPRVGVHEGFTRLVFDLPATFSKEVRPTLSQENGLLTLTLKGLRAPALDQVVNSPEVVSVQTLPEEGGVRVLVRLKGPVEAVVRRFSDPERLVVDLTLKRAVSPVKVSPTTSSEPSPNRVSPPPRPVVLLDPGHGGVDPGMVGYVVEKEVVLDVTLRLKRLLEGKGIEVRLTRDRDAHLSPDKREDLSRRAALADSSQVNLFISIHVNASPTRTAQGVEAFYFGRTQDSRILAQVIRENGGGDLGQRLTQEARSVAERILTDILAQANQRYSQRLAETLGRHLAQATGSPYRGAFPGDFFVLRYAKVPAVLVEIGFGDHPVEGRHLADPAYRVKVAEGLLSGVLTFLANGAYAR